MRIPESLSAMGTEGLRISSLHRRNRTQTRISYGGQGKTAREIARDGLGEIVGSPDFDDVELVEAPAVDLGVERRRHPARTNERTGEGQQRPDRSGGGAGGTRIGGGSSENTRENPESPNIPPENSEINAGKNISGIGGRRKRNEAGRRRGRGGAPYLAERRLPREELVRVEHSRAEEGAREEEGGAAPRRRREGGGERRSGWGFCEGLRAVGPECGEEEIGRAHV